MPTHCVGCSYLHNGFQSQPAVGSVPRFRFLKYSVKELSGELLNY